MMRELALFAGAGGGLLASHLLGWRTVCAVEINSYCRSRLFDRQRDGCLPRFPIWDDVCTFDGRQWRGHIDVISGGFPCQDISAAGQGRGITGARSGLVFEMLRIVDEVRPAFVFAENSPQLRAKGLATIVERFICMGYVGRVGVLGAGDIGANHKRKRMWIVAYSPSERLERWQKRQVARVAYGFVDNRAKPIAADADGLWGLQPQGRIFEIGQWFGHRAEQPSKSGTTDWWGIPRFAGVDDGMADRLDRVKATGNGQVPGVAALAWSLLTSDLTEFLESEES